MNWNKAKTILIIFFICTNLFLLATILISADRTSIVTDDIVSSTTLILKNNQIEIDPEIIPRKTYATSLLEAENWIGDYAEFAKKFIGENAILSENSVYTSELGSVSFSGDKFEFIPASPVFSDVTKNLSDTNYDRIASGILKKYDFSDSNLLYENKITDENFTVTVTKQKDSLYFFNSELEIVLAKDGVRKISGSWFFEKNQLKEKVTLKNITGVLIDYISVANRPTTPEKIVAIDLGYSILEEGIHHKFSVLTPCWRITLDNGAEYILNGAETTE